MAVVVGIVHEEQELQRGVRDDGGLNERDDLVTRGSERSLLLLMVNLVQEDLEARENYQSNEDGELESKGECV